MSGTWKFSELTRVQPIVGYLFGWVFVIYVIFLLIPYFYGVMLNTYTFLR
jgi:hypothetical protein